MQEKIRRKEGSTTHRELELRLRIDECQRRPLEDRAKVAVHLSGGLLLGAAGRAALGVKNRFAVSVILSV